jgi:hypothetical protein
MNVLGHVRKLKIRRLGYPSVSRRVGCRLGTSQESRGSHVLYAKVVVYDSLDKVIIDLPRSASQALFSIFADKKEIQLNL